MIKSYEVVIPIDNKEAIEKIRAIVLKLNGYDTPEYWNNIHYRFQFRGNMIDAVNMMAEGAAAVSKL